MVQKDIENYQELLDFMAKNNNVAVLYFHTYSLSYLRPCTPCKLISPHLDSLHKKYPVPVCNINLDKVDELATKFDVRAIPTFILVKKTSGEIELVKYVVSAHVEKLTQLFEMGADIRNKK